jgi:hypothetical protein
MRLRRFFLMAAGIGGSAACAADPAVEPASGWRHRAAPIVPATPVCPPGSPAAPGAMPGVPAPMPAAPGTPGTLPGTPGAAPGEPGTPGAAPGQPGLDLSTPPANSSAPTGAGDASSLLAQGTEGGTSGGGSALPTVFGDLLGGGVIAGPLPVKVLPNGTTVPPIRLVGPNGQRVTLGAPLPGTPFVDERLAARGNPVPPTAQQLAAAPTVGILPPAGFRFDDSLADFVSRVPQVYRGAFKIAENDTPRPTTRAYFTYNFYDQISKNFSDGFVPRIMLHQEVFGYEQAFLDRQFSVAVRLPYNQLVSPGFVANTSLGDLTLIGKAVLWENRETGNLLSAGLVITAPTGTVPFPNTLTGRDIHDTLIQPYGGYIYNRGDFFAQGFSSIIIPTISDDVTFLANDLALGYNLYKAPGSALSGFIPTVEFHLNTPLDHRGAQNNPVGFVDQFTVLGGGTFFFRDRTSLGFATGTPITGPRPFSLQATAQLNVRF